MISRVDRRQLGRGDIEFAERVFADSVDWDRIVLTNLVGFGRRPFTVPGLRARIYCNLGAAFSAPLDYTSRGCPAAGQLFIHELTHAWQICNTRSMPRLAYDGVANQVRYAFGANVYAYGGAGPAWNQFNLEQQASIVDNWFGGTGGSAGFGPMSPSSPYFRYIDIDVRGTASPRE